MGMDTNGIRLHVIPSVNIKSVWHAPSSRESVAPVRWAGSLGSGPDVRRGRESAAAGSASGGKSLAPLVYLL